MVTYRLGGSVRRLEWIGGDGGGSISLNSKRLLLSSPIVYPAPGLLTQ